MNNLPEAVEQVEGIDFRNTEGDNSVNCPKTTKSGQAIGTLKSWTLSSIPCDYKQAPFSGDHSNGVTPFAYNYRCFRFIAYCTSHGKLFLKYLEYRPIKRSDEKTSWNFRNLRSLASGDQSSGEE